MDGAPPQLVPCLDVIWFGLVWFDLVFFFFGDSVFIWMWETGAFFILFLILKPFFSGDGEFYFFGTSCCTWSVREKKKKNFEAGFRKTSGRNAVSRSIPYLDAAVSSEGLLFIYRQ